jgi:hypothetical protein
MMKTPYPACNRVGKVGLGIAPASFFDIVNGFLIDAVAHGFYTVKAVWICMRRL